MSYIEHTLPFTTTTYHPAAQSAGFAAGVDRARSMLDTDTFDHCVRTGAAMTITEAVHYAHHHIQGARLQQP
mgnify:CR=1 FL=1